MPAGTPDVTAGSGYNGVHAAETEPEWTFYRGLVGTGVSGVASTGAAPNEVTDRAHQATEPLARQLTLTEQWYNYATNVRGLDIARHRHPERHCRQRRAGKPEGARQRGRGQPQAAPGVPRRQRRAGHRSRQPQLGRVRPGEPMTH
jgi:hypothetical protein